MSCDNARCVKGLHIGSITNCCSGKGPSLLPSWGGASTGLESAVEIEPLSRDDPEKNNFDSGYNTREDFISMSPMSDFKYIVKFIGCSNLVLALCSILRSILVLFP